MADPFADIAPSMLSQNIQRNDKQPIMQQQMMNQVPSPMAAAAAVQQPAMTNHSFNSMHNANNPYGQQQQQQPAVPNPFQGPNVFDTAPPNSNAATFDPFASSNHHRAPAPSPPPLTPAFFAPPASRPVSVPPMEADFSDDENDNDATSMAFDGANFTNPDDTPRGGDFDGFSWDNLPTSPDGGPSSFKEQHDDDMQNNVYEVEFPPNKKLGVLMERVDAWTDGDVSRKEAAVVKLVVENGAADVAGVTPGSVVLGINGRDLQNETYATILSLIKTAPRPLVIRLFRVKEVKDESQGHVLTRISGGTFSVGNIFTSGNARWTPKYFAFGGARMDVLQLFVSRAAYHECVIALYEKRAIHTEIQSFRLCRDHKVTPIKSKVYKGYGNLHYFSLNVPALHFVAAKFASDDYDVIKTLWTYVYDAVENQKRMHTS